MDPNGRDAVPSQLAHGLVTDGGFLQIGRTPLRRTRYRPTTPPSGTHTSGRGRAWRAEQENARTSKASNVITNPGAPGAGSERTGVILKTETRRNPSSNDAAGFLDDAPSFPGRQAQSLDHAAERCRPGNRDFLARTTLGYGKPFGRDLIQAQCKSTQRYSLSAELHSARCSESPSPRPHDDRSGWALA